MSKLQNLRLTAPGERKKCSTQSDKRLIGNIAYLQSREVTAQGATVQEPILDKM